MLLIEEKTNAQQELSKLQKEMERLEHGGAATHIGDDGVSLGPVQVGSARYSELRRQMDMLKEELLQSETAREDLKIKSQQQDKEMLHLQQRIEEYIVSEFWFVFYFYFRLNLFTEKHLRADTAEGRAGHTTRKQ